MKMMLPILALVSSSVFAAPLIGTCRGLSADCVGPKLDPGTKITKRCELNEYRTSYYVYEYSDAGRGETGASVVSAGSGSAVSDGLARTTYPGSSVEDAVVQSLVDDGSSQAEAKVEAKKMKCKALSGEVL